MTKFLKKRWHGIPLGIVSAILVVCLLAGGALAAYNFFTMPAEVTVIEGCVVGAISALISLFSS
ncbi:unnamed protein product [marine sediment metagenome]|uniref:Uncharacterized protein n=1 Tax=marine sediment metagenome TaxID=412755 RepID=X1NGQ7_9ZZZZ